MLRSLLLRVAETVSFLQLTRHPGPEVRIPRAVTCLAPTADLLNHHPVGQLATPRSPCRWGLGAQLGADILNLLLILFESLIAEGGCLTDWVAGGIPA